MADIPLIELKKIIDAMIDFVRSDYASATDKSNSWIYRVFNGASIDGFNFYTQGLELINRTDESSRKLETRIAYDRDRATMPTIFIHMPGDALGGANSLGINPQSPYYENEDGTYSMNYTRNFSSKYEFLITSNNTYETIFIYELLQHLFIAGVDTFNNLFQNIEFNGGKDLMINRNIIPHNTYMKSIVVNLTFKRQAPSIATLDGASNVEFTPTMSE